MLYSILSQTHPDRDDKTWKEYEELYRGGSRIVKNAEQYLPRQIGEPIQRYHERLQMASYINYFGSVVNYFAANLFVQDLFVSPASDAPSLETIGHLPDDMQFYQLFAEDADRSGTSFSKLMRTVFIWGLVKGVVHLGIDFPEMCEQPATRLDEEETGASRAYAFLIQPEEMLDWRLDQLGGYDWCVLHRVRSDRETVEDSRDWVQDEFKVWRMAGGKAVWELYQTERRKPTVEVDERSDVRRVASGTTSFTMIPILSWRVPEGLWVGDKIGTLAKEHFQSRSSLRSAESRSLFAIPYVKLGPEIGGPQSAMPSEVQQDASRGSLGPAGTFLQRGFALLGADDAIGFAEPLGTSYALVDKQLSEIVDEMYRTAFQMSQSISHTRQALARSASSKRADTESTTIILSAYGKLMKEFATDVYELIAEARGESVVWEAHGLDKFMLDDRSEMMKEAMTVQMVDIPSATFKKLYFSKAAVTLLGNIPPTTQETIAREVSDSIDFQMAHPDLLAGGVSMAPKDDEEDSSESEDKEPESTKEPKEPYKVKPGTAEAPSVAFEQPKLPKKAR